MTDKEKKEKREKFNKLTMREMMDYIAENHPEDKTYYIIDRNSKDLEKIQQFGNIIYADTFKHYLY